MLVLGLGLSAGARAQQADLPPPPPRYPVDGVPTQNACTTQLLINDRACTFEIDAPLGQPDTDQAHANEKAAAVFARACATAATHPEEAQPDPILLKSCEESVAQASLGSCSLEGRVPLLDPEGRWAVRGRECASRLQGVLAKTRTQAAVSLGCCRCVADARCEISAPVCSKASQSGDFPAAARACVLRNCSSSCLIAPAPEREKEEDLPFPPKPRRSHPT